MASSPAAATHTATAVALTRHAGLDLLRAAATLLVVFHHAAITYGAQGGWFYRELAPGDAWSSRLLSFFCALNQAWFMGLFFLLAGYFTPPALARKGALRFLAARALRLGLPWLLFVLLLGPLTMALARTARGDSPLDTLRWLAGHPVFEPGPLWFAQALMLAALGAALWHLLARVQRLSADIGPVWQALSRRAFAIYVIHPSVLVAEALAWATVPAPALLKFVLTGTLACALCYGLASALLRLPGVARVL